MSKQEFAERLMSAQGQRLHRREFDSAVYVRELMLWKSQLAKFYGDADWSDHIGDDQHIQPGKCPILFGLVNVPD
jgi:hypothetical protein